MRRIYSTTAYAPTGPLAELLGAPAELAHHLHLPGGVTITAERRHGGTGAGLPWIESNGVTGEGGWWMHLPGWSLRFARRG